MNAGNLGKRIVCLALGIVVLIAFIAALLNRGVPATAVDLNDAGVWVTNSRLQMVAHLNHASRTLDAAVRVGTDDVDVFQNGDDVQIADLAAPSLAPVDVARARLGGAVTHSGMAATVGGSVIAYTKVNEGSIWRQQLTQLAPINSEQTPADITGMPAAITTVGSDGSIHVVSAEAGQLVTLPADAAPDQAKVQALSGIQPQADLQIAAVGEQAVVLDRSTSTLYLPSGATTTISAEGLQLQDNGPSSDKVLVASTTGIHQVPLNGGEISFTAVTHSGGSPTRPVRLGTCSYSAWTGQGAFLRDCEQDFDDVDIAVDSLSGVRQTRFRVNRTTIVLNDMETGSLWLPDEMMLLVEDWDQVNSTLESEEESQEESAEQANDIAEPQRAEENTPPVAANDTFGVRAGRSNVLPVILNDSDADGDYLTVTSVTETSLGTVTITREGGALHIVVPPDASGSSVFEYEISDGRGGTARAQTVLTVHEEGMNSPPVQLVPSTLSLGAGRSATVNALANWYDPDGDPFYLDEVKSPEGLAVRHRELGSVDVTEDGGTPGHYEVAFLVSDGRDIGEGKLDVTVRDQGNLPPITNTDHVVVRRDSTVTISPLDNDTDPNGDSLRLVQVEPAPDGITVSMDGSLGTLSITGVAAGSYYLGYVVTDGPATSTGYVRVDVVEPDQDAAPTAEDDIGVLPVGGPVFIDLLANDYDSSGGVLTVSQVDVEADSPLAVALLNRQLVRVTARQPLTAPTTFTYIVSNGVATATAAVTVIPGDPVDTTTPPELTNDKVVVRSGDVANVAVLDNDRSPAGLGLSLEPTLQHEVPEEVATVFQSDDVIRIRGGSEAGSGSLIYTAKDSAGNVASATVEFTVVPVDEDNNTAPRPKNLVARTGAGQSVTIPVPLDGIDREGDSVVLLGIASSPSMGTVEVKGNAFSYTAAANSSGTDTFNYLVEDRLGKQATGTVRVGISPAAQLNQAPVTTPDEVSVRPGTAVAVAVLSNDIDPDGDRLSLLPGSITDHGAGLNVDQRGSRITLRAPDAEGTHMVSYTATDSAGGQTEGVLTVVVAADAPLKPPIARDDALTEEQVAQARTDGRIVLQVLDNDEDPDGDINDVTVTSHDSTMTVLAGGEVEIALTPTPQVAIYSITDSTGLSSAAIIRVPGLDQVRPVVDTTNLPIRVVAGEAVTIPINDYVRAREDRQVILTSETTVSAGVGADGSALVVDRSTLTFRSTPEFAGETSITFEVTDGSSVNDPEGRTAVISLPIEVTPSQNQPPSFRPTALQLRQGESTSVDLASMATDRDGDSLTFTLSGDQPAGVSASVTGTTMQIQVAEDATIGDIGQVLITVADGRGGSVEGGIPITVTDASNAPIMQITGANVTMEPGGSQSVDILNHVVSAASAEGPVRIVGSPTATQGGTASVSGTTITLTADAGYTGSFTTTYVAVDGDGAADRQVTGVITATVLGRPAPPTAVTAVAAGATTAQLSWTAGAANGSPITSFTVTDHVQGDSIECGLATSCLIGGRTPGISHRFSVTATNAVGTSDPSATVQLTMDMVPAAPAAPTVVAGDGRAQISWNAPSNQGSPILYYEVLLSPGFQVSVPAAGDGSHSTTITGLTNGAEYVAMVRAVNAQGASPWSQGSSVVRPFGPPSQVRGLTASLTTSFGTSTGTVQVSWSPPASNGRPIEYYTVTVASISKRVSAAEGTSTLVEGVPLNGAQHTVTVTATNDSSRPESFTSAPSTTSVWGVGVPNPPIISGVTATGVDNQVRLNWSASPAGGGWSPHELSYEWNAGAGWRPLTGETLTGNGLSNGVGTTISIRAVGSKTGSRITSSEAVSAHVVPYGAPVASTMNCTGGVESVTCEWSGGHGNGRGASFTLSGAETGSVGASGSRTFRVPEDTEVELCITTTQEGTGVKAPIQCDSAESSDDDDREAVEIDTDGLRVTMTFTDFEFGGVYSFECWNATSPGGARPENYLGYGIEGTMVVPRNGTVTFTCSGNPHNPSLRPNSRFGVQFMPSGVFYS